MAHALELEFKMEWCGTGSLVAENVKNCSYEEVFGHPQPGFDKKKWESDKIEWKWKSLHPGFMPVDKPKKVKPPEISYWKGYWSTGDELEIVTTGFIGMSSINPNTELHVQGKIGMEAAGDDPNENLRLTDDLIKPSDVFKRYKIAPEVDINSLTKKERQVIKEFQERVKALHYDLERAKDQPSKDKLMDEFAKSEFPSKDHEAILSAVASCRRNSRDVKDKTAEFFNKTWDLRDGQQTKNLSNRSTDYSDYAEFLEEYFDEGE